jgi:hypothetical protein
MDGRGPRMTCEATGKRPENNKKTTEWGAMKRRAAHQNAAR